jgi:short-subunit dehydrogenase
MRRRESYFASKLVLITGGTSGIGLALANALGALGARIVVLADKAGSVARAGAELSAQGFAAHAYVCDVGVPESVTETARIVLAVDGVPDIVINNAGYATYRTFEQEEPEDIERLLSVNLTGAIRITKAFLEGMIERRSGHIVNIASLAGVLPITPCAVYTAAKYGTVGWSRCLMAELARFDINVTVICPGRVKTAFFDHDTFRNRRPRRETELTVPMETVVEGTLDAILRRQRMRHIPHRYGLLAWAYQAFGPILQRPFDRLSRSRVEDLYKEPEPR